MSHRHFIITGTSRGIGEQLAKMLLENGYSVHGISRGDSNRLSSFEKYVHIKFDLIHTFQIEQLISEIIKQIDLRNLEMVCLINNAALVEPLLSIDRCNIEDIHNNLQVNLIAPMVLTSCFTRETKNLNIRRKIINISSGSGTYPMPDMSVYCTTKAGINMFTQCVGVEQSKQEYPIEIVAVDPGMVETEMQMIARGKKDEDFEMAKFFKESHQSGLLQSSENLGRHLLNIIEARIEPGKLVSYSDY